MIPELLVFNNAGKMSLRSVVELSYLTQDGPETSCDQYCLPSYAQAIRIQKLSKDSMLIDVMIKKAMEKRKLIK